MRVTDGVLDFGLWPSPASLAARIWGSELVDGNPASASPSFPDTPRFLGEKTNLERMNSKAQILHLHSQNDGRKVNRQAG